jgi:hypothetical protein
LLLAALGTFFGIWHGGITRGATRQARYRARRVPGGVGFRSNIRGH